MANLIIYKANLKAYKPITWEGQPVYDYFPQLKDHLYQILGSEYSALLAEPYISDRNFKGQGEATWRTASIKPDVESLANHENQDELQHLLDERLLVIQNHINKLLATGDNQQIGWGNLLKIIFEPSFDASHVFYDNNKFVIVMWGLSRIEEDLPTKKKIPKQPPASPTVSDAKPEINTKDSQDNKNQEIPNRDSIDAQNTNSKSLDKKVEDANSTHQENSVNENTNSGLSPKSEKETKPIWKKYWWVSIPLVLLMVIPFILTQCNTVTHLPKESNKIIPVDTTKIVKDPDGVRMIVGDRLNIALIGDNKNLDEFAKAFKQAYPEENYQIIYYDTLTYRLQLQIPSTEREKVEKELPGKLKGFEMLIFPETIMGTHKMPSDPGFGARSDKFWYHERVKAFGAWDLTIGDSAIVVAIIDGGFDMEHPEYKSKVYKPINIVKRNTDISKAGSGGRHGTHVAGTAVGIIDNGQGVSGIAPDCRLMPIQVSDDNGVMSQTAVIDGILYAINSGANVVNLSLGMRVPPDFSKLDPKSQKWIIESSFKQEEEFYKKLFKTAYDKNIAIILAGGNQDVLIGLDPMQRSGYTINVSASDSDNDKAGFSNYGEYSTLSAPGVQIYNSIPNGQYDFLDGTSMAAPIVTGGVALIKSENPTISLQEIVDLLQSTGIPVSSSKYIGNIIQLDQALGIVKKQRDKDPKVDCPDVQTKIDSLLQEIRKLREGCGDSESGDTLKIPDSPDEEEGFAFALGKWKSTTHIYNTDSGDKVTIYFDFKVDGTGTITLVEQGGVTCSANLNLNLANRKLSIDQRTTATCSPDEGAYSPYMFTCESGASGYAECTAQNKKLKSNAFTFKLIKVK